MKNAMLSAILGSLLLGCSRFHDTILEADKVQFFKVEEVASSGARRLRLSGLAFYSALCVRKTDTFQSEKALVVIIHLGPAKGNCSGSFSFDVDVPDTVSEVQFGNARKVIWSDLRSVDRIEKQPSISQ